MTRSVGIGRRALLGGAVAGGAAGLLATAPALADPGGDSEPAGQGPPPGGWAAAAADVRNEMLQTWNSYKRLAFGHDQLMPVSGGFSEFFDDAHPVGLTIVEALDTLGVMGLDAEVAGGVAWIRDHLDFHPVAQPVQLVETNVRIGGWLLFGFRAT